MSSSVESANSNSCKTDTMYGMNYNNSLYNPQYYTRQHFNCKQLNQLKYIYFFPCYSRSHELSYKVKKLFIYLHTETMFVYLNVC